MGNLKSLALLALLFSLSLAVFADTSNDATHAKDEVKPSTEASDAIEPQQREPKPEIEEAQVEANDAVVEPQQIWGGGCRFGCCGGWWYGGCIYCCMSQAEAKEVVKTVEPQQRRGCRHGCCGSYAYGQCSACCSKKIMATEKEKKKEEAKP
ncbi:hypothetical protein ISN45_Aa04g026730 [Arabidopsis thaliana x Arabidopsis arenosa]|uniref:Uncharacterized protein n=1 Tax=Arabidopsis thaliana x Arabidopsis arenosa TaxID=1240361 RepID=A0A8T2ACF6_9BRAS|nr:hypothetical protein ISN45_Aa04g026730 [Arabidopsis thaliana x Arabidopsis arenosa]